MNDVVMNENIDLNKNYFLQQNKARLAKVLSKEKIDVRFTPGITTASFDIDHRIVHIPVFKTGISEELLDLFIIHEIGHALYTPKDWKFCITHIQKTYNVSYQVAHDIFNVLEDIRINEKLKEAFPGAIPDFRIGYQHRLMRGDYGKQTFTIKDTNFLDRLNIVSKVGHVVDVPFRDAELPLLSEAKKLKEWEDVKILAEKIVKYLIIEEKLDRNTLDVEEFFLNVDVEGLEDDFFAKALSSKQPKFKTSLPYIGTSEDSKFLPPEKIEEEDDDNEDEEMDDLLDEEKEDDLFSFDDDDDYEDHDQIFTIRSFVSNMVSKTSQSEDDAAKKLIDMSPPEQQFYTLPEVDDASIASYEKNVEKYIISEGRAGIYSKWMKKNLPEVNYMFNIFQMMKAARDMEMTSYKKTGILDSNSLVHYKTKEDIFQKNAVVHNSKNHGFVMLLDTSSSMGDVMKDTLKQIVLMVTFFRKIGVPYVIYSFSDYGETLNFKNKTSETLFSSNRVSLAKLFDSKMSDDQFRKMCVRFIDGKNLTTSEAAGGGTPLKAAILALKSLTQKFVSDNKVDIVNIVHITDGGATDHVFPNGAMNYVKDTVSKKVWSLPHDRYGMSVKQINEIVRDSLSGSGISKINIVNFFLGYGERIQTDIDGYDMVLCFPKGYLKMPNLKRAVLKNLSSEKMMEHIQQNKIRYRFFLKKFVELVSKFD